MKIIRFSAVLLFLAGAGCATVRLPHTAEAQACKRECMAIANQCAMANGGWGCIGQRRECLLSCPGAY